MMTQADRDILIKVHTLLEELAHRLYGNGREGDIGKLQLETKSLTAWRNRIIGAVSLVGFALTIVGGLLVKHLMSY